MILMVAMKQCRTRIIGHEINLDGAEPCHVDGIFHHARRRLVAHLGNFERMPMADERDGYRRSCCS
jgi:hypothetical protein